MEEERRTCIECGEELHGEIGEDFYEVDGEYYCQDCFFDNYIICEDCGEIVSKDESYYIDDGDYDVCQHCYYNNYTQCYCCNATINNDNAYYVEDGEYGGDYYICENCRYNGDYETCEDCGDLYHVDNLQRCEDGWYCNNCREDNEERENYYDNRVYSYHTFRNWQLYKSESERNARNVFYIGTEIELEPKGTARISKVIDAMEKYLNAVAMSDGSLNSGGVEIITHAETFKYRQEHKESYRQFFNNVEELEYGNNGHTGLHFHITRPNNEIISRIIVILESFKDEIKTLSRRNGDFHWSNFISDTARGGDNQKVKYQSKKWIEEHYLKDSYHDRYSALNLTNRNTIEFRFFKGANNFEEYWGALQFINNIMTLASDTARELETINWKDLIKGKEIEEQAKKLGVYDIDKNVRDTTDIIEKLEMTLKKSKEEIKCILRNLARYINKEMSEFDLKEIKTSNVDYIDEKINAFMEKFKYKKQYLDKIMRLYNYLVDETNTLEMENIKRYWEDTKMTFPVNTERYSRYNKLIEKVIKNYESEVM